MIRPARRVRSTRSFSARDLAVPPALRAAYRECRRLTRRHGTTYYWATQVLPAERRPHVQALYGFCRHADEIVDAQDDETVDRRRARLDDLRAALQAALATGSADPAAAPAVAAVAHTATTFTIDPSCFERFLRSMAMDLTVATYRTWDELCDYMDGSAAVIGEMMLPVLGGRDPRAGGPSCVSRPTGPGRCTRRPTRGSSCFPRGRPGPSAPPGSSTAASSTRSSRTTTTCSRCAPAFPLSPSWPSLRPDCWADELGVGRPPARNPDAPAGARALGSPLLAACRLRSARPAHPRPPRRTLDSRPGRPRRLRERPVHPAAERPPAGRRRRCGRPRGCGPAPLPRPPARAAAGRRRGRCLACGRVSAGDADAPRPGPPRLAGPLPARDRGSLGGGLPQRRRRARRLCRCRPPGRALGTALRSTRTHPGHAGHRWFGGRAARAAADPRHQRLAVPGLGGGRARAEHPRCRRHRGGGAHRPPPGGRGQRGQRRGQGVGRTHAGRGPRPVPGGAAAGRRARGAGRDGRPPAGRRRLGRRCRSARRAAVGHAVDGGPARLIETPGPPPRHGVRDRFAVARVIALALLALSRAGPR